MFDLKIFKIDEMTCGVTQRHWIALIDRAHTTLLVVYCNRVYLMSFPIFFIRPST